MLGSAVRLPYHQPEKKDLSVFLARTELKQQKFVGSSRMSWKHFVPPSSTLAPRGSSVAQVDSSLSAGAVTSEKVVPSLPLESSTAVVTDTAVVAEAVVEQHAQDCDVLPDLSVSCSKSVTVASDIPSTSAEVTDTHEQLSSKGVSRKLLLLSPIKKTPVVSEPLCSSVAIHSENSQEQVETLLAPAIGKKLLLDPVDKNEFTPSASRVTDTVASEAVELAAVESGLSDCVVVGPKDEDDQLPQQSTTATVSSRVFRRVLPSNIPLPQLSGNPDDVIELDNEVGDDGDDRQMSANDQGVERLMERLLQHVRGSTRSRKPKTIEIR